MTDVELVLSLKDLENIKAEEEKIKSKKESLQNKIIDEMKKRKIDSFNYVDKTMYAKTEDISVKLISPVSVIFDADKIERKVSKSLCKKFISKQYEVINFEGLVEYLSSCGVSPKIFKTFINAKKKVDNSKLDNLSKLGEISEKDLEGCYTTKESKSYLKITKKELEG